MSETDIRKSLLIESGDLFRRSEIGRSQRALYESNFFRRAVIDTAGSRDTVKSLVVRVQEGPLREARVSAGFTTADFGQVDARFTHNYWLGGARRLDLGFSLGNLLAQQLTQEQASSSTSRTSGSGSDLGRYFAPTYQASADVRQRWFQSPRNTIGGGVFTHRRSSPNVFVDRGYGANATFTRELAERTPLSATYRFEIARVEAGDVYFCVNYGVCDDPTIDALRGQQRLSPVALTMSMDRTDAPSRPRAAFSAASRRSTRRSTPSPTSATIAPTPTSRCTARCRSAARWARSTCARAGWTRSPAPDRPLAWASCSPRQHRADPAPSQALLRRRLAERARLRREPARPARAHGRSEQAARTPGRDSDRRDLPMRASTCRPRHASRTTRRCSATRSSSRVRSAARRCWSGYRAARSGVGPARGRGVRRRRHPRRRHAEHASRKARVRSRRASACATCRRSAPFASTSAFRPTLRESLPVITQITDSLGVRRLRRPERA